MSVVGIGVVMHEKVINKHPLLTKFVIVSHDYAAYLEFLEGIHQSFQCPPGPTTKWRINDERTLDKLTNCTVHIIYIYIYTVH